MRGNTEALREALQRIVDWDESGYVLTADHIEQARAALAQQAAAPTADAVDERMYSAIAKHLGYEGPHEVRQAATPAPAEPVREDELHFAVCLAVQASNDVELVRTEAGRKVRDILRQALVDYADAAPPATPAAQPADGWIAVADRVPEEHVPVLAWCASWPPNALQPFLAQHAHPFGFLDTRRGGQLISAVTHWRPLPAAPSEGSQG